MTDYIRDPRDLAARLRDARRCQGVAQSDLALAIGTKQSAISEVESGGGVTLEVVMRIAGALGLRLELVRFTPEDVQAVQEIVGLESDGVTVDVLMRIAAALGFRLALAPFTAEDEEAVARITHDEEVGA